MIFVRILVDLQKIFLKPLNLNITLCINQMLPPGEDPQGSHELGAKGNWPFLSSKNSHFQNEAFLVTMSFICMKIKNHFQINGFVLSLALKLRLKVTQKWLIVQYIHCPKYPGFLFLISCTGMFPWNYQRIY